VSEHGHDGIGSAGDSHNHREYHDGQRTDEGDGSEGEGGDGGGEGHDHEHDHHDVSDLGVGIVTVSTSRSIEDDPAGDAIRDAFEDGGHQVTVRELIDDSFDGVQSTVNRLVDRDDVDIVVTTGGTGVTPDDVTVEAVADLMHKTLPGFGELFRRLSYDEIGTRVVGTRATAGVADHTPVFCLPGSENAARLGTEEILVPEAPHLAGLASRE
jgi:molybdenum cofactor biosynthesis protein B